MEFNASIVGLIVLLLIFVPIVFLMLNASGPNKKAKKLASKLSETNGIQLKNFEVIGNCVIGVDTVSKKLVYTSKSNPSTDFNIINMEELTDCRAKSIKQTEKTLDWVGLEIVAKTGKKEITFYNEYNEAEIGKDPFVCLQDAKRWENMLRPLLKAS